MPKAQPRRARLTAEVVARKAWRALPKAPIRSGSRFLSWADRALDSNVGWLHGVLEQQLEHFRPDVVLNQDIGFVDAAALARMRPGLPGSSSDDSVADSRRPGLRALRPDALFAPEPRRGVPQDRRERRAPSARLRAPCARTASRPRREVSAARSSGRSRLNTHAVSTCSNRSAGRHRWRCGRQEPRLARSNFADPRQVPRSGMGARDVRRTRALADHSEQPPRSRGPPRRTSGCSKQRASEASC